MIRETIIFVGEVLFSIYFLDVYTLFYPHLSWCCDIVMDYPKMLETYSISGDVMYILTFPENKNNVIITLSAMDVLAPTTMKNAAKCDT